MSVIQTKREELFSRSMPVEGNEQSFPLIGEQTRLYHEIPMDIFPAKDFELRWFTDGIYLIGPGDVPSVFQVPMARITDMVIPREYPLLPLIGDPGPHRDA